MIKKLPIFQGYTVDVRLQEFRKANLGEELEFISFKSQEGDAMLSDFVDTLDPNTQEGLELLKAIWR